MPKKLDPKVAEKVMLKAGYKALETYTGAHTKWKCTHIPCGEIVYPTYNRIRKGEGGCNICGYINRGNSKRIPEKEAVAFMLKAGLKPLEPYKGALSRWKCKCLKCKKIVHPQYTSIQRGSKCEYCSKTKVDAEDAIKIMLKSQLRPLEPYKNADTKWKCLHTVCGEIVYPRYSDVNKGNGGCKPCGSKKSGELKRISEKIAIAVMLKINMQPLEPFVNPMSKWKCKCLKCGKISYPNYGDATQGHGCAYCGGNRIDLKDAHKLMLKSKLKPLEPYKSALSKWKCECLKCGKIVYPQYSSIQTGQGGCRYCAVKGINMNTPSYLYLITNYELNSHKVGMGNHKKLNDRLKKFVKYGWKVHKVWETNTGAIAIDIETEVLRILRKDLKLPIYLSKSDMPKTEGHTETVDADEITLLQLEKIINKVIKGLQE